MTRTITGSLIRPDFVQVDLLNLPDVRNPILKQIEEIDAVQTGLNLQRDLE